MLKLISRSHGLDNLQPIEFGWEATTPVSQHFKIPMPSAKKRGYLKDGGLFPCEEGDEQWDTAPFELFETLIVSRRWADSAPNWEFPVE